MKNLTLTQRDQKRIKSNQKHLRYKKKWQACLTEKDMKPNGGPMPPDFDRLENFGHEELTAKHCYFRCSRPPDVDGIKIF